MAVTSERGHIQTYGYAIPELTMPRVIADKAARNGDKIFLTFMADQRAYSYRDMDDISTRIACALMADGIGANTHVGMLMENSPEQILLYFALGKLGAVAVPINTSARGRLLTYLIQHGDCTAAICDAEFVQRLAEVLPSTPGIAALYVLDQEASAIGIPSLPNRAIQRSFLDLVAGSDSALPTTPSFDALAMLTFTSGTTGPSKANMLVQAAVVQNGMTTAESHGYRFDDVIYIALPLNHANAYLSTMWGAFVADASVALSRRFSVSRYWQEVRDSGATITNLLGSMVNMLWSQPERADDAANRLRLCNSIPVPKFAVDFEKRFGCRIVCSYGQTDYANCTVFTLVDPHHKLGSSGRPRSGIELAIVDEHDMAVPNGVQGEIVLRSNNPWSTSMGYYKNPAATLAGFRNGWWHTGDHGYVDDDGYLFFGQRKKDALRRRGENISAYEVESIIFDHPAVADVAVYGVPSEMSEDEVAASVVLVQGGRLSHAELIQYCIANMAHYMVPRYLEFVADLPRTPSQKVQKVELRSRAAELPGRLWDREAHGIVVTR